MKLERSCIPLGFAWSSPFARWQGPLAEVNSIDLAVDVTGRALKRRGLSSEEVTDLVLGWTVPQKEIFYGAPTVAARLGAEGVTGPMISQACATSVACIGAAAANHEGNGDGRVTLVIATDRTSNGPVVAYPSPSGPGGSPQVENWVLDSFAKDPWAGAAMVTTGENVAAEAGITREELDEVTAMRYDQYRKGLANDREFQKRYMVHAEIPQRRKDPIVVDEDAGVFPTTREGLSKLKPVAPDGVVTYGSQTHPADGTAGMVVTGEEHARELSGEGIARLLGIGFARVEKARMPKAPVPAAQAALKDAGVGIEDVDVIKTHNPFAVNDVYFSRQMGVPVEGMNDYGSSLIFGHPQGPTGARLIAEMIEQLRARGGGTGLFTGCAAGDSGAALVLRVED